MLDHRFTCPDIEVITEGVKQGLESNLSELLHTTSQVKTEEDKQEILNVWVDKICDKNFNPSFEQVRFLNTSIRNTANKQIDQLKNTISDQEEYIQSLLNDIRDLKIRVK